ncbi:MAG: hypothetical protein HFK06_01085 [Clostridia bacterium]|nr:hypothetical protein [Clostridia bacterium]
MKLTRIKNCSNCNYCKCLYEVFFYVYRNKRRYCEVNERLTDKENVCEKWESKKGGKVYDFSAARFDEVERDLKYITDYYNKINKE